ncbi:MAG TPA: hypothetical protein DCK83_00465 [Gallionellaceae bacterium]|nr:hypothetical protein [Gallionellaceae bacterium]
MGYKITINSGNEITDLFRDDVGYATPPADAIPVTQEQGEILRRGFSQYKYIGGELVLNVASILDAAVKKAVAETYADVDAIYAAAIGNRAAEYEQAEQAAQTYQAAGYIGTASAYVSDYAAAAGITDQQSADIIIARAAGLRAAVLAMRSTRFTAQAAMRAAMTQADLDVAVSGWKTFIASIRTSLGL